MNVIIGINANHADSSSCIIVNGELIVAIEEERINRVKHYSGYPINSIKECLKIANINDFEITDIAFNTKPFSNMLAKSKFFLKNYKIMDLKLLKRFNNKINIKKILFNNFNLNKNIKFHYIEHHLAHIASAFYPSKFDSANGLSIDGSGDFSTLAIAECSKNKINIKKRISFPNSLGIFYHAMTQFLGFNHYGDEYKVMGLAAYGKPLYFDKIKKNLFTKNINNNFELNLNFFRHHTNKFRYLSDGILNIDKIYNEKLETLFKKEKQNNIEDNFAKNFACSVQKIYEFYFSQILKDIKLLNFSNNLVFAGGCALNSSANKLLTSNTDLFVKTFIPFAPGDNGGALGAAFVVASKYNLELKNIQTPYIGRNFKNNEIEKLLKLNENKIDFQHFEDDNELCKKVANKISNGKVVGWFQGKMEFGPRALGNRSILADPRNPKMKDIINSKIKRRESFRPFAPAILKQHLSDWYDSDYDSPYMSSLANIKKNKAEMIPAVTHIDGTARLQTVNYQTNPKFEKLITLFYEITDVPILLNTSFNENEPMINKPEEALDCFLRTDMDYLILNNYFVKKVIYK